MRHIITLILILLLVCTLGATVYEGFTYLDISKKIQCVDCDNILPGKMIPNQIGKCQTQVKNMYTELGRLGKPGECFDCQSQFQEFSDKSLIAPFDINNIIGQPFIPLN